MSIAIYCKDYGMKRQRHCNIEIVQYNSKKLRWPRRTLPRRPKPLWATRKPPLAAKWPPIGCGWPPLAVAAQPHPPICLKIDSLAYDWLTIIPHACSRGLCLCHRPHDTHRHLGTVDCNGDQIQQRNRLGLV